MGSVQSDVTTTAGVQPGSFRREVQRRARGQRRSRIAGPQAPLTPCSSLPA